MNYTNLPGRSRCVGCMGCVTACAKGVLCASYDADQHLCPLVRDGGKSCVDCGRCVSKCPVLTNARPEKRAGEPSVYAAWAKDDTLRSQSASGGAFIALAQYYIGLGWLVWGAVLEGFSVHHECANDMDGLRRMQGSKYVLGDMTGVYAAVASQLCQGKNVLFSGLPCQCAAMRLAADGMRHAGRLILVDLVCGGVPSQEPCDIYRRTHPHAVAAISYRDKKDGWKSFGFRYRLRVRDASGREIDEGSFNALTFGFVSGIFRRNSCTECLFSGDGRCSDITIGDFWGIADYPSEHPNGISCVVANTASGECAIVEATGLVAHRKDYESLKKGNPRVERIYSKVCGLGLKRFLFRAFFRVRAVMPLPIILLRGTFKVINAACSLLN